jgi:hypothetical protein
MSKKGESNSSSGYHPHDESNIEDNEVKLREAISSLRALVSGEGDIILLLSYVEIILYFSILLHYRDLILK